MNRFVERFERDRRLVLRHNLKTPLRVRLWKPGAPEERTESENLSEKGVFFSMNTAISKGDTVQVLLKMPECVTGSPATEWHCTGHVVRTEVKGKKTGVAVEFDFYQVSHYLEPRSKHAAADQPYGHLEPQIAASQVE